MGILCFVLGIVTLTLGIMLKLLVSPGIIDLVVIGIILTITGILLIIGNLVFSIPNNTDLQITSNHTHLSSRLTEFYRYVVSSFILGFILVFNYLIFIVIPADIRMIGILISIFATTVAVLGILILLKIKVVYYTTEYAYFKSINRLENVKLNDIHKVSLFIQVFYKVGMKNGKYYFFIPHISEMLFGVGREPKSIIDFRKSIERTNSFLVTE